MTDQIKEAVRLMIGDDEQFRAIEQQNLTPDQWRALRAELEQNAIRAYAERQTRAGQHFIHTGVLNALDRS